MKNHIKLVGSVILIAALVFAFTALSLTGCSSPTNHHNNEGDDKVITSITVTGKTEYEFGEELDYESIQVVITYSDGTTETYSGLTKALLTAAGVSVYGYDPYEVGTQTITVWYKESSKTFTVTVYPPVGTGEPDTAWYDDAIEADPDEYEFFIGTPDELAGLMVLVNSNQETFFEKLVRIKADLNLSVYGVGNAEWNDGAGWIPIGDDNYSWLFNGMLDGGGHTITGLSIDNDADDCQGLFSNLDELAIVTGLTLKDVNINGNQYVGGVAGQNNGRVENCAVSGSVKGSFYVGGVAGQNNDTVENCEVSGSIIGSNNYIGGVAGENTGTVEDCAFSGSVKGSYRVGGVVGWNDVGGTVMNCYASGSVIGDHYVGGVAGYITSGTVVENCHFIAGENAASTVSGRYGTVGGVVGQNNGTVKNCDATGDVSDVVTTGGEVGGVAGYNWGTLDTCYAKGTVSGAGDNVGGVAGYNRGTVKNCYFTAGEDASGAVTGQGDKVGGVVGYNDRGTVNNCHAAGAVSGPDDNDNGKGHHVGGVVGHNKGEEGSAVYGRVENCYFTAGENASGTVTGAGSNVGGVVGWNEYGILDKCCFTAGEDATGAVSGAGDNVGGVAGMNEYSIVQNCYFSAGEDTSGNVSGAGEYVGGVVGYNYSSMVENCYAEGNVTGAGWNIGGVAGSNVADTEYSSDLVNCYAAGNVTGEGRNVGGVVGYNQDGHVDSCYATGTVAGELRVGGVVGVTDGPDSLVENCVALQSSITSITITDPSNAGRVIGVYWNGTIGNNYADQFMEVNEVIVSGDTTDEVDGKDITDAQWFSAYWWSGTVYFNDGVWTLEDGQLPKLEL